MHAFTFRKDQLPPYVNNFDQLLYLFIIDLKVDAVFTDFPDIARKFIDDRFETVNLASINRNPSIVFLFAVAIYLINELFIDN